MRGLHGGRDNWYELERRLDRDAEREPPALQPHPRPHRRRQAQQARFADIMCGALVADDAGVLQPPVKLGGGS